MSRQHALETDQLSVPPVKTAWRLRLEHGGRPAQDFGFLAHACYCVQTQMTR
jgi:hypothetical protein